MRNLTLSNSTKPRYKDLPFRFIAAIVAAHFIVVFGEELTLAELLLHYEYYVAVAGSFGIAFSLISLVYIATRKLDAYYDWKKRPVSRVAMQLIFGVIIPSLAAYLLAALYFSFLGVNILDRPYLRYDFPVIMVLLLMLNFYYLCYYLFLQVKMAETSNVSFTDTGQQFKNSFLIQEGTKNKSLNTEHIGAFYREGMYNFILDFSGKSHLINQTLDDIQNVTDPEQFFRANRQVIINYHSCDNYELLEYGKLRLYTEPPLKQEVIISQRRAKDFKNWMER